MSLGRWRRRNRSLLGQRGLSISQAQRVEEVVIVDAVDEAEQAALLNLPVVASKV